MQSELIVIIDDEKEITSSYEIFLKRAGHSDYMLFNSPAEFIGVMEDIEPAVVFLDLRMPQINGEELLDRLSRTHRNSSIFIVSGTEDVSTAVRCIKNGALDYIVKPIDKDRFHTAITKGLEIHRIKKELAQIKDSFPNTPLSSHPAFRRIITRSPSMTKVLKYVQMLSVNNTPVLITGETGTGKELLAEAVHLCSGRGGGFVPVNASALDENMFNDTLFGHKRGSFTGADRDRAGLLATAESGTVFLDEIGDLKESSQIKLLRLLQNREYLPIGSDRPLISNARIVAATNANLREKVDRGTFRQDLFYRLSAHTVHIPPLRERCEDIELLFHHFFSKQFSEHKENLPEIPSELIKSLRNHTFPGNVRELEAIVANYAVMFQLSSAGTSELKEFLAGHNVKMDSRDLSACYSSFSYEGTFPSLKEMEQVLVEEALKRTSGNQSKAASLLGISRQALNKRVNS